MEHNRIWIGIDGGKSSHHACAVDETGAVCWSVKITNTREAIEALIVRANSTTTEVRWAIDLSSSVAVLLITMLATADAALVYVPGRVVNTMTSAFRGEGKTDAKDAKVIAETARLRIDLLPVKVPDDLVETLRQLTAYRTGKISGNLHRPTRYNRRSQRVFYLAALSSLRSGGSSRTFYEHKRAQNRTHTHALMALAR